LLAAGLENDGRMTKDYRVNRIVTPHSCAMSMAPVVRRQGRLMAKEVFPLHDILHSDRCPLIHEARAGTTRPAFRLPEFGGHNLAPATAVLRNLARLSPPLRLSPGLITKRIADLLMAIVQNEKNTSSLPNLFLLYAQLIVEITHGQNLLAIFKVIL